MSKVKSLAGTGKTYKTIQFRERGGHINFQGKCAEINRDYGVAQTIERDNFNSKLYDWLKGLKGNVESLADTGEKYHSAQAILRGDTIHFQVAVNKEKHCPTCTCSTETNNRAYGASFDVPKSVAGKLYNFLKLELL